MSGLRYWNSEFWAHVTVAVIVIICLPIIILGAALVSLIAYLLS